MCALVIKKKCFDGRFYTNHKLLFNKFIVRFIATAIFLLSFLVFRNISISVWRCCVSWFRVHNFLWVRAFSVSMYIYTEYCLIQMKYNICFKFINANEYVSTFI